MIKDAKLLQTYVLFFSPPFLLLTEHRTGSDILARVLQETYVKETQFYFE